MLSSTTAWWKPPFLHLAVYTFLMNPHLIPHKQANVYGDKPNSKATVQTTVNLLLIYCSQNSQAKAECRYCSSPGITPQGDLLLLVPVLRPTALCSKNHKQETSKAFQIMLLQSASEDLSSHMDTCSIQLQVFTQIV